MAKPYEVAEKEFPGWVAIVKDDTEMNTEPSNKTFIVKMKAKLSAVGESPIQKTVVIVGGKVISAK